MNHILKNRILYPTNKNSKKIEKNTQVTTSSHSAAHSLAPPRRRIYMADDCERIIYIESSSKGLLHEKAEVVMSTLTNDSTPLLERGDSVLPDQVNQRVLVSSVANFSTAVNKREKYS